MYMLIFIFDDGNSIFQKNLLSEVVNKALQQVVVSPASEWESFEFFHLQYSYLMLQIKQQNV